MPRVDWPDLEEWLCDYVRDVVLAEASLAADVSNKEESEGPFPAVSVIIRDDGRTKQSVITGQHSVGVTVFGGTRRNDGPVKDIVRPIFGALTDEDLPLLGGDSCPIASVDDFFGWYSVAEDQDVTRLYFTVTYTVAGSPSR